MSETGSSAAGSNEELDDPGRDPVGLNPPRNPLSGGLGSTTGLERVGTGRVVRFVPALVGAGHLLGGRGGGA